MPKITFEEYPPFFFVGFLFLVISMSIVVAGLSEYYKHVENMKKIECGQLAEEKK